MFLTVPLRKRANIKCFIAERVTFKAFRELTPGTYFLWTGNQQPYHYKMIHNMAFFGTHIFQPCLFFFLKTFWFGLLIYLFFLMSWIPKPILVTNIRFEDCYVSLG